jgi:hypothetical protein
LRIIFPEPASAHRIYGVTASARRLADFTVDMHHFALWSAS